MSMKDEQYPHRRKRVKVGDVPRTQLRPLLSQLCGVPVRRHSACISSQEGYSASACLSFSGSDRRTRGHEEGCFVTRSSENNIDALREIQ